MPHVNRGDIPPHVLAALDQDLAAAQVDLDRVVRLYRHLLAQEGDVEAMVCTAILVAGAPCSSVIGMLVAALHRWAPPS